jgi:hypothetical protein
MSLVTLPPLVLLLLPTSALATHAARRLLTPVLFSLGLWLVLVHLPGAPRHDEVRQFVSVYPLLGLAAWAGLLGTAARLAESKPREGDPRVVAAACLLAIALLVAPVARAHPFELSYYNSTIGGVRGAERYGMELSLYFEAVDRGTLAALNHHVRPGQTLFMSPHWPALLQAYADHGLLNTPMLLLPARPEERPDWLLLLRRRYLIDDRQFVAMPAVHEVRYEGVSLVKLVRTADLGATPAPTPPVTPVPHRPLPAR